MLILHFGQSLAVVLLGPVAVVRNVWAIVIKLSRGRSVGSGCLQTASGSGPGMKQVVGFADRSTGRGTFGGEFGARHCIQWGLGQATYTCVPVTKQYDLVLAKGM